MPAPLFQIGAIMENSIKELYFKMRDIVIEFIYYNNNENCKEIVTEIPQIQNFIEWFMQGNRIEIDDDLYTGMCSNLIDILKDILSAIENKDHVLLNDAIAYGLMNYLKIFMSEGDYNEQEI